MFKSQRNRLVPLCACRLLEVVLKILLVMALSAWSIGTQAADRLNILDYAPPGTHVDRTGHDDVSEALINVIKAANTFTAKGEPACIYIPPGIYRIKQSPPEFARAGCVKGDGPTQSVLVIDPSFSGDLLAWSEAWEPTTPGPTVVGIKIVGSKGAEHIQNAMVFYDRNDEVFIDNVVVNDVHGRALYSGVAKHAEQAYMRESHLRSLRFFRDGAPNVPVVEFCSEGTGKVDATNEIRLSQIDIYGSNGPSFVVRNKGSGGIRNISVESLRIEGAENGTTAADLMTIGDPVMKGAVNSLTFSGLELIDPYPGYAALRLTAAPGAPAPYHIAVQGSIGGGLPYGEGIRIDAGRSSTFTLSSMYTLGTNVVIGPGVSQIVLDGAGQEACWTYRIDPKSENSVLTRVFAAGIPSAKKESAGSPEPKYKPSHC
jgi:hypothetical protein